MDKVVLNYIGFTKIFFLFLRRFVKVESGKFSYAPPDKVEVRSHTTITIIKKEISFYIFINVLTIQSDQNTYPYTDLMYFLIEYFKCCESSREQSFNNSNKKLWIGCAGSRQDFSVS